MRSSVRTKLLSIVGVAAVSYLVLIALGSAIGSQVEHHLSVIREQHVPSLELAPRLESQFERVRRSFQDAVAAQDLAVLAETDLHRKQFLKQLDAAQAVGHARIPELRVAFEDYYTAAHDVSERLIRGESGEALVDAMSVMRTRQLRAAEALKIATALDPKALAKTFNAASQTASRGLQLQLWLSISCLALVLGLSLWLSRGLVRAVAALADGFERFGRGKLEDPILATSNDELGLLATRANDMARSLLNLHKERDRVDSIKSGRAALVQELQGELEAPELARRALAILLPHLKARAGVFYQVTAEGNLQVLAQHAATGATPGATTFRVGEGLAGHAAGQTELLVIDDIPADYFPLRSGLGEARPNSLLLLPLLHAGKVNGLLELATWQTWSGDHAELLTAVRETLAIALEVATARSALRALLLETQQQALRLAAQEEDLRSSNEELQVQQEELRQANDELREQALQLERGQRELEQRNSELDSARQSLEQKAHELSTISTYKSQFLANMSHELRTPLNSMLLLSNLLADNESGNLTDKQVEFCKTIHGAGRDLLALINQVLDLAKIESGKMEVRVETLPLHELLDQAERVVGPLARDKGLEFHAELEPGLPATIETDRQKLEQIVTNLVGNAVKFTERGSVRLRIARPGAGTAFGRAELTTDNAVSIMVSDTGIGIAPEHQRNIFVQFEQVDARANRRYGGTGLGLTIARQLAELLGGELQLQSTPGAGSTFTCHLPRQCPAPGATRTTDGESSHQAAKAAQSLPPPAAGPATNPPSRGPNAEPASILVIEDDATFADIVAQSVQVQGFRSVVAHDGTTGLRLARELLPAGIILDVRLPDVDGFSVMELLRANPVTARIPVHFVSGVEAGERGMALGAVGYLTKPASRRDLVRVVQSLALRPADRACRLLIVEDDPVQADSLLRRLEGEAFEVVHATDARAALQALEHGPFQCLVLDLGLPDMDGLTLLKSIQERCGNDMPNVVIYTGRALSKPEVQRLEAYADAVILKDGHSAERLLDEVRLFARRIKDGSNTRKHAPEAQLRLDGHKVLLVDDDMRTVYALSALLRAKGAEVFVADTGRAALNALDEHPDAEIVLMDIMMPEMDGYDAMRHIRKDLRFSQLPIVALTAKAMKGDREKCLEAGATDYLPKPVDPERLMDVLRSKLGNEVQHGA